MFKNSLLRHFGFRYYNANVNKRFMGAQILQKRNSSNAQSRSPRAPPLWRAPMPPIEKVTSNTLKQMLEVHWGEMTAPSSWFPYVWLRDNCQCEECFHPISLSRTMQFEDLQLDVEPVHIMVLNATTVDIAWSDGHRSSFPSQWLRERVVGRRQSDYKLDRILWGSDILKNLPTANFHDILTDDGCLLAWLQQLEVFGFVLVTNAPIERGSITKLVERVAFVKKTHYGKIFSVTNKPDPSNVAYSRGPLQLHTDLPYYDYKPGIQLIHCLVQYQGIGAESMVADSVHVAKLLKEQHPQMYKVLTDTLVDWCDVGEDEGRQFFKVLKRPVLCLDSNGVITRVNFSHPQRDSFFNIDPNAIREWYKAMKMYSQMLHHPDNCLQFKMTPGTIQTFDNLRIVHGRRKYGEGEREVEGCYMDWDEARSMRRVIERNLNLSSEHWVQRKGSTASHSEVS